MRLLRTAALLVASGFWIGGCGARTNLSDLTPRAGGGTGSGGDAGSCCAPGDQPGCENPAIEQCVCEFEPSCCTSSWSSSCALIVDLADCGECPQGSGGRGAGGTAGTGGQIVSGGQLNTGGVIPLSGGAPNVGGQVPNTGGVIAVGGRNPSSGGVSPGGGPASGGASNSCCMESSTPSCADGRTARCVCDEDQYCCAYAWDDQCVARAQNSCGACGGGTGGVGAGGAGGAGGSGGTGGMIAVGGQGTGGSISQVCSMASATECGSCLCDGCPDQLVNCAYDTGCLQIFLCVIQTGCTGVNCLRDDTCGPLINDNTASLQNALGLVVCAGNNGCNCF